MAEETENKAKISIWWDIENCHVPKDVDPHYIAQNITAALQRASLTGPIEIQVFGDTMILPHVTQKALSDTGITLNHVPRGNKDAADKAILVAMLLWALDNPPPANVLLISGDGDFANALHRLRLKTYSILLAIPQQFVKPALTGAAKKLWFWKEMAQGQLAELQLPQSNGDASSKGPIGLSRSMDMLQQRGPPSMTAPVTNVPAKHSSALPNGYFSPQKRVAEFKVGSTIEHFRSLSLESHPSSFSLSGIGNRNRSLSVAENESHASLDSRMCPGGDRNVSSASNRLNASQSQPLFSESSSSAVRNVDIGKYPYFLPQAGEKVGTYDSTITNGSSNNPDNSSLSMSTRMPVEVMPRGPLKHITTNNNNMGAINESSLKSIVSDKRMEHNVLPHKNNAARYRNANSNLPPASCQPTASTLSPDTVKSDSQMMSHDSCLDKVYSALKTLERDMLAPTESNLSDCIQHWDPQHDRVDVKLTLIKAAELKQITKTQLGGGLVMFFPPKHQVPWNCIDPGNMQYYHPGDVWLELQQFLLYSEKKQVFLSSRSRYDAAILLKNSCGVLIQSLIVGQILNLLQQAMQERKWLRKNGLGWAPLFLNQKVVLDWSGNETLKGDLRPSTNQANTESVRKSSTMNVYPERVPDKSFTLSKLRGLLPQILEEGTGYDLSLLPEDFGHATGMPLKYQALGYANLQELMKEFADVAYLQATNSGVWLYPVKLNGNVVGHHGNIADKENESLRQIDLVRELKVWLSQFISTFQDGYDIAKVQEDFLQARGKDLNREGLDFNKLQCILNQFRDVFYIARSPGGLWLAYPVKGARNAIIPSS